MPEGGRSEEVTGRRGGRKEGLGGKGGKGEKRGKMVERRTGREEERSD